MDTAASVPAWPLYELSASDDEAVHITGPAAPTEPYPSRPDAIQAVALIASRLHPPRPVRARATDTDGTTWPLIIHPGGEADFGQPTTSKAKRRPKKEQVAPTVPVGPAEEAPVLSNLQRLLAQAQQQQEQAPTPVRPAVESDDPHQAMFAAAAAGRHGEAAAMAAAWEKEAMRAHGPESSETVHWIEVQAELARQAGDPARASGLWIRSAVIRLSAGQPQQHPEVAAAVDRAHHCWQAVTDPRQVQQLGIELLSLRTRVTGKSGALQDVQRRLAKLNEAVRP